MLDPGEGFWWKSSSIVLVVALLQACAHPDFRSGDRRVERINRPSLSRADYRLSSGDQLRLQVIGESELSEDAVVDDRGLVSLPLVGLVQVRGLKIQQAQSRIRKKFETSIMRNPVVSVRLSGLQPLHVAGEVRAPGKITYLTGMSVRDAIAAAGGYTYRSKYETVFIRARGEKTGHIYRLENHRIPIHPGDFVRVPERFF